MNWVVVWIPVFLVAAFLTFYSFFEWNPFTRSRKPLLERDEVSSSAERSDDLLQTGGPSPLIPLEPRPPSDIEEVLPEFYTLSESHLGLVYEGTLNGSRVRVRRIGTPPGGDSRNVKHVRIWCCIRAPSETLNSCRSSISLPYRPSAWHIKTSSPF